MKETDPGARWEEIAKEAAKNVLTQFSIGHYEHNCEVILSAIAESHQSETEQPERELVCWCEPGMRDLECPAHGDIDKVFPKSLLEKEPSEHSTEETQKCPDWKSLATYLAKSLRCASVISGEIYDYIDRQIGEDEMNLASDLNAHLDGTDIGCSMDFGIWFTKDGWTTAPIPGMESEERPQVNLTSVGRGNDVGAALLSKESEVASLQRKLEDMAIARLADYDAFTSQRDVIEQMRKRIGLVVAALKEPDSDLGPTIGDGVISWPLGAEIRSRLKDLLALSSPVPTEATKL